MRRNADNSTSTPTTIITDSTRERGKILQFTPRLPEQWKQTRTRNKNMTNNRERRHLNRDTHLAVDSQAPNNRYNPTRIPIPNRTSREEGTIPLKMAERLEITAQDRIDWDHFIRGRVAKEYPPVIQQYYTIHNLGKCSTPLRWFIEINTRNFLIHQVA